MKNKKIFVFMYQFIMKINKMQNKLKRQQKSQIKILLTTKSLLMKNFTKTQIKQPKHISSSKQKHLSPKNRKYTQKIQKTNIKNSNILIPKQSKTKKIKFQQIKQQQQRVFNKKPPLLRRQNSIQSPQFLKKQQTLPHKQDILSSCQKHLKQNKSSLIQLKFIQSDQQSTKINRYISDQQLNYTQQNKQREQTKQNKQQNNLKMQNKQEICANNNPILEYLNQHKLKIIKSSKDLSVSLLYQEQTNKKSKFKNSKTARNTIKQLNSLRQSLHLQITNYKQLSTYHNKQCEQFGPILTEIQEKRLIKIQSLQKISLKNRINSIKIRLETKIKENLKNKTNKHIKVQQYH